MICLFTHQMNSGGSILSIVAAGHFKRPFDALKDIRAFVSCLKTPQNK